MLQNVADIRVKKRLCHDLLGRNKATCKKYVTFFVFLFSSFLWSNIVKVSAATPDIEGDRVGKDITVSAVVLLTDEFTYLIRKNSEVTFGKKAFVLGEEGEIQVLVRGEKGDGLKNHRVAGKIFNIHQEEVASFFGETDSFGKAIFHVKLTEQFLGENTVWVADVTYGEPVFLMARPSFIVYETRDAKEKTEKSRGQGISGDQLANDGLFFGSAQNDASFYQKSVTIALYRSIEALSRAGPT